MTCLLRSIPEDPAGIHAPDVLDGLDPDRWAAAGDAWEEASLALGATIRGRLFGAALALVPDRHRWRAMLVEAGDGRLLTTSVWQDPARCLLAARARFAADVVDEAGIWRVGEQLGLDDVALRNLVRPLAYTDEDAFGGRPGPGIPGRHCEADE